MAGAGQEEAVPNDFAAVLRQIRKTLTEAWRLLDEDERRRVVKRLYLKWHPDKNPGREEFCIHVVQAIQRYVDLFKEGKSLPDDEDDTSGASSNYRSTSSYSSFFERMNRRGRTYRDHYESNARSGGRYGGGGRGWGGGGGSNPQPMEGCRWFLQAKADLAAAQNAKGSCEEGYNWICYMCHQAVEKALKSILYRRDADSSFMQSHELGTLACVVGDSGLIQLTSELEGRLGDHTRMLYPDVLPYPRIPANDFTETDATFACDIASRVIDGVHCLS